jgi:hypothetical protein
MNCFYCFAPIHCPYNAHFQSAKTSSIPPINSMAVGLDCPQSNRRVILGLIALAGIFLGLPAKANECEELIKMHGLLGRAYVQCHYTFYSRGFAIQAEACGGSLGDKTYKKLLSDGTAAFEAKASEMGQAALCTKILKDFPYTVRQ